MVFSSYGTPSYLPLDSDQSVAFYKNGNPLFPLPSGPPVTPHEPQPLHHQRRHWQQGGAAAVTSTTAMLSTPAASAAAGTGATGAGGTAGHRVCDDFQPVAYLSSNGYYGYVPSLTAATPGGPGDPGVTSAAATVRHSNGCNFNNNNNNSNPDENGMQVDCTVATTAAASTVTEHGGGHHCPPLYRKRKETGAPDDETMETSDRKRRRTNDAATDTLHSESMECTDQYQIITDYVQSLPPYVYSANGLHPTSGVLQPKNQNPRLVERRRQRTEDTSNGAGEGKNLPTKSNNPRLGLCDDVENLFLSLHGTGCYHLPEDHCF